MQRDEKQKHPVNTGSVRVSKGGIFTKEGNVTLGDVSVDGTSAAVLVAHDSNLTVGNISCTNDSNITIACGVSAETAGKMFSWSSRK